MLRYAVIGLMVLAALMVAACTQGGGEGSGGEHSGGDGEESAVQLGKGDAYDEVRGGTHLTLSYDADANEFTGRVVNVTDAPLSQVRVEVHLSNGVELGPTPAVDLEPGAGVGVALAGTDRPFETWSAHAEVGGGAESAGEHGGGEGGERSENSGGEHSGGEGSEDSGGEHSGGRGN